MRRLVLVLFFVLAVSSLAARADDHPEWTTPLTPFRIADNLYYVGSRDLASYLITTPRGDILINSNLTSSPPQIRHSVEQLGFHWSDIKILLISHAHFDHASGSAEILRETHAKYMVMDADVPVVESGGAKDFAYGPKPQYPAAHVDRILHDGSTVTLGNATLTAHKTAGHTRGCTTWTMRVHVPGEPASQLRNVVIVGSWYVNPGYRLVASHGKPASYPGIAADYEHAFVVFSALPCDIFLGAHGMYFDMLAKLARMPRQGDRVWIDPDGYRRAVAESKAAFAEELHKQQAEASTR
ncbi:MAG TPA: subclass B3 metallo-beta-lactamase [Candidatus Aquilonibacter sp.]|nr:subclass B3 metallo-beta-lactamase [Candidatus Aquilonibacter sp.]